MKRAFSLIFFLFLQLYSLGQISTFPYSEDFETSNGGWVSGGTGNDWVWGRPTKTKINSAGSGNKCWVAGGLTSGSYNNGERSYVESPRFNFSNLSNPYLEIKIFIETEDGFDGAGFQYSTNGGSTWTDLGTVNEPTGCFTANWFQTSNINYLTGTISSTQNGWSGSSKSTAGSCVGGGASGSWITAKHCMKNLGGQTNVKFRFTFGAGTSCNNYDGFAFDLVKVTQAPRFNSNFNPLCQTPGTFKFSDASTNCPTSWKWNFGDGISSTSQNPFHTFSNPGLYTVQLIASNSCAIPDTFQTNISYLGVTVTPFSVGCNGGSTGSAKVIVVGQNPNLPISYYWNSNPPQNTDSAILLAPGTYSVTVSQPNTCPVSKTFTISGTPGLSHSLQIDSSVCQSANGQLTLQINGGVPPYSYQWIPSLSSGPVASGISPGPITIVVRDASGCKDSIGLIFPSKSHDYQPWLNQFNINTITPNDDGYNDDFLFFEGQPVPENYSMEIFNRWGNVVFKSTDPTEKWNGKWNQSALPDGSYFYSVRFEACRKRFEKSGFIQVLR